MKNRTAAYLLKLSPVAVMGISCARIPRSPLQSSNSLGIFQVTRLLCPWASAVLAAQWSSVVLFSELYLSDYRPALCIHEHQLPAFPPVSGNVQAF